MATIRTFGPVDDRSLDQLKRCMEAGDAEYGVLCADHHPGYSQPIGGGIAYEGSISPSGVGYDIACGNKAVQTALRTADLADLGGVGRVMREIERRISFGMGVPAQEKVDHPVLDKIADAPFEPQRKLRDLARNQLGTVGSGNHYVNVFEDEGGRIWVGVHFGSRGFGHKTAAGFLALAQGLPFDARAHEGEMDSPPVLFEVDSELGQAYIEAMQLAGEYAYAGRDVVVDKVLDILGTEAVHEVHNHHNFAWREEHFGRTYWVVRKGCTPAQPGQEGFVGGSMGDDSVILEGVEGEDAKESLYSTVHGAGRVMSRMQAAGKVRRRTVYACSVRDCSWSVPAKQYKGEPCPIHPVAKVRKVRTEELVRPGLVDWDAVRARLREQGIVLIGGGADEAPEVYKRLPEVLDAHQGSIRINHTLRPLGVAMAGRDVFDPYID
jgi:tRNA-splicing ligase RtcB (3'-phosphate/5'-hydroxy nucleic acid ligase)